MEVFGSNFGQAQSCRICQYNQFLVELGYGTRNGNPISVLTIRCPRCGTPLNQMELTGSNPNDVVTVEDGIVRVPQDSKIKEDNQNGPVPV